MLLNSAVCHLRVEDNYRSPNVWASSQKPILALLDGIVIESRSIHGGEHSEKITCGRLILKQANAESIWDQVFGAAENDPVLLGREWLGSVRMYFWFFLG